jgi:hypothetical protein
MWPDGAGEHGDVIEGLVLVWRIDGKGEGPAVGSFGGVVERGEV